MKWNAFVTLFNRYFFFSSYFRFMLYMIRFLNADNGRFFISEGNRVNKYFMFWFMFRLSWVIIWGLLRKVRRKLIEGFFSLNFCRNILCMRDLEKSLFKNRYLNEHSWWGLKKEWFLCFDELLILISNFSQLSILLNLIMNL